MTDPKEQIAIDEARQAEEEARMVLEGVREYSECDPVEINLEVFSRSGIPLAIDKRRIVIHAKNEGGCSSTNVDLLDLIGWLKKNRPELLS